MELIERYLVIHNYFVLELTFLDVLKDKEKISPSGVRSYDSIHFKNGIRLSIQAGSHFFCLPRKNLPLDEYQSMEVAVLKDDGYFVDVGDILHDNVVLELVDRFDGQVYSCVPVETIEKLYRLLQQYDGLSPV
jgi:hypothetical protein